MKVLLINPPSHGDEKFVREGRCMQRGGAWTAIWSPVTLATAAALLRDNGIEVKLYDCVVDEINREDLKDILSHFKPDMIVINSSTPSINFDMECANLAGDILPDILTVAIGIHVSALPFESLMLAPRINCVVIGEPERTILKLSHAIKENTSMEEKIERIKAVPSIAYKEGFKLRKTENSDYIEDLDSIPFPAWDLINVNNYQMPFTGNPFLLVSTGRGCPHHCTYCSAKAYYGQKLRLRSIDNILDEIERNINEFGVREFLFWTEAFTMNNDFAIGLTEGILKRDLDISWVCNSRVDDVTPELLKALKKAGCTMIGYGIESGNPEILKQVKKGIKIEDIKNAVKWTKEAGLSVTGHMMVGFPGENEESINMTVKLSQDLDLDFVQFYAVVPFPGSELFDTARKNNTITDWNFMKFEQNYGVLHTGHLTPEEVTKLRSRAYKQFYFRPSTIFKTLKRISSPKTALRFIQMARDFLTWI